MRINSNNYELFVIDYLEGTLDEIKSKEMQAFLMQHPAIALSIEGLSSIKLKKEMEESLGTNFISQLKQPEVIPTSHIHEDNFERFFIAQAEHDIGAEEVDELNNFLALNPHLNDELKLMLSLRLQSNPAIHFPDKESLKKSQTTVLLFWPVAAAVAAIFGFVFWLFLPQQVGHPKESMVSIYAIDKQYIPLSLPHDKRALLSLRQGGRKPSEHLIAPLDNSLREPIMMTVMPSVSKRKIQIEDTRWRNTLLLMQSYAFDRTQMFSEVDWNKLPVDHKTSAFRMLVAMMWKTTKGQIKNVGQQVKEENRMFWKPERMAELSAAYDLMVKKSRRNSQHSTN